MIINLIKFTTPPSQVPQILGDLMKNPPKRGLPLIAKCWFHGENQPISQKKTSKWVHLPQKNQGETTHIFIRCETTYHVDRGKNRGIILQFPIKSHVFLNISPRIPTTIKTMGVNITTIAYLRVLIIEIGSTIIFMVVEAQGIVNSLVLWVDV